MRHPFLRRGAGVLVAAVVVTGCASTSAHAAQPTRRRAAVVVEPATSTTSVAPTPAAPTPTAVVPVGPGPAGPTLDGDAAMAPPRSVVVPPSAFVGTGVPQPGSYFRSLLDDHSLDGTGMFVALTFDDGPGPYTRQIVDVLNLFGVKATFFQIANQTAGHVELVKYMASSGMHLASHSRGHSHLTKIPPVHKRDQIVGGADVQDSILGPGTTKCFRPPFGQYDQRSLDIIAGRGLATAMWSVDTNDWKSPGLPTIVVRALTAAKDRSILLLHDGGGDRSQTIQALPWIIIGLRNKGFTFIPVC